MFIFFQNDDARAFAHHETVAILVIRAACFFGAIIKAAIERTGLCKTGHAQGVDRAFRTTGQHDVGIAILDHAGGIPNGMRAR